MDFAPRSSSLNLLLWAAYRGLPASRGKSKPLAASDSPCLPRSAVFPPGPCGFHSSPSPSPPTRRVLPRGHQPALPGVTSQRGHDHVTLIAPSLKLSVFLLQPLLPSSPASFLDLLWAWWSPRLPDGLPTFLLPTSGSSRHTATRVKRPLLALPSSACTVSSSAVSHLPRASFVVVCVDVQRRSFWSATLGCRDAAAVRPLGLHFSKASQTEHVRSRRARNAVQGRAVLRPLGAAPTQRPTGGDALASPVLEPTVSHRFCSPPHSRHPP